MTSIELARPETETPSGFEAAIVPPLSSGLTLRVADSFEVVEQLREQWDLLVQQENGDIYQTFDWCRIWWKHFGHGRRLRLFLFNHRQQLVAVVPWFIDELGWYPLRVRVAKFLGAEYTLTECNPVIRPECLNEVLRQMLDHLVRVERCDAMRIGPTNTNHSLLRRLREGETGRSGLTVLKDAHEAPVSVFPIPESFNNYLSSLDKKERSNYKHSANMLAKAFATDWRVFSEGAELESEFDRFADMHQLQWEQKGRGGHFIDWPGSFDFHKELISVFGRQDRVRLIRLSADGEPVSYRYSLVLGSVCYTRLTARLVGKAWDRFGLGRFGMVNFVRLAIEAGMKVIDAGQGHYDFKQNLGAEEHLVDNVILAPRKPIRKWKASLAIHAARLIDIIYEKIWSRRVKPRLRLPPRPFWQCWIRTRL